MSESFDKINEKDCSQKKPPIKDAMVAYALYLGLLYLTVILPEFILAKQIDVQINQHGFFLILLTLLPAKSVFSIWMGIMFASTGILLTIFVQEVSFELQKNINIASLEGIWTYVEIISFIYSLLAAEVCLFIVRKITNVKITMF